MAERILHLLCVVFPFSIFPLVKAGEQGKPAPASTQIVVWVRAASEQEMRLSRTTAPALRDLARRGISFPRLAPVKHEALTQALRATGKTLGAAYREIVIGDPAKPEKKAEPEKRPKHLLASGMPERTDKSVMKALEEGARLITIVDNVVSDVGGQAFEKNLILARIALAVFSGWGGKGKPTHRSYLFLVLIPETGPPACIMAGHALKRGRFFNRKLDDKKIIAGIKALLSAPTRDDREDVPDWISEAHLPTPKTEKGGQR